MNPTKLQFNPLKFRSVRLSARRTLVEVAGAIGTTPTSLSRWELGKNVPLGYALIRWCAAIEEMLAEMEEGEE